MNHMDMMNCCVILRNMQKQQLQTMYQTKTCGWWLCNHFYEDDSVELVSAYGQGSGTNRENIKANTKAIAVRPAMWVTWQGDMNVVEN